MCGTRHCRLISFFVEYNRIIKDNGCIALNAQQPFATDLINANRRYFRYEWVWDKRSTTGFLNANRMPLKRHELVLVFYKSLPTYNPQKVDGKPYVTKKRGLSTNYGNFSVGGTINNGERYPTDIVDIPQVRTGVDNKHIHPTQKPVKLCEYLIKTYTNEGETVLDNCMGSGTTAIACMNTKRNFIGFEVDKNYYNEAIKRIEEHERRLNNEHK